MLHFPFLTCLFCTESTNLHVERFVKTKFLKLFQIFFFCLNISKKCILQILKTINLLIKEIKYYKI